MYLGSLLVLFGISIILNPIGGLSLIPLFILYLNLFQIIPEENAMVDLFKDEFLEYRKNVRHEVPQYATKYFDLEQFRGKTISFIGEKWVQRFKAKCPEICWWSNTGDYINTTLTFNVDLTNVKKPTAKFKMWHDIEKDWDYLYFAVSVDQGITWTTLEEATITTNYNPSGSNYGNAYTGTSDWAVHDVELAKYSGQEVLVRLSLIHI